MRCSMIVRRGAAALLFALTTSAAAAAQVVAPAELQGVVARIRADASPRLGHETVHAPALIARLYERRAFAPVWDSVRGVGLLHALRGLAADGLEPLDYHLAVLESDGANPQPPARAAELDVLRTDALLRAAYDLRFGRVDARTMRRRTDLSRALTGTNADAAAALLLDMHPASALERVRPGHFVYRGLRDALRHLEQVRGDGGWATIPPGRLSLDSINARVPLLRRRLAQDGDLQGDTVSSHFDATVDSAVRRFQHRHGLNDDGIVGPATLAALNVSVTRRIDAVRVNLERARW
ncbi:MAG TPA: peptidoglycan-binding protein, partial [Longimicrobiales bacterium]|nr:peptidoglycan-binding protein [Longimicrobiales bacterium]